MNVLITQNHLADFAGSEIIVLELAQYFADKGWLVHVLTNYYDLPIKKEFSKLPNVHVFTDETTLANEKASYGLLWVHHQLIPNLLHGAFAESSQTPLVIFNHMSPYEPFEYPRNLELENSLADLVLANSAETYEMLLSADVRKQLLHIFGNPAPDAFASHSGNEHPHQLTRLLAVSNHFPPEILSGLNLLREKGVEILGIGATFTNPQPVTPEIIKSVDAILSIGKTVQFSLLSRKPVYLYDHFGGPGYLSESNYHLALKHNFSGRGFGTKQPETIAEEIINDFAVAQKQIDILADKFGSDFLLSQNLESCLKQARQNHAVTKHTFPEPLWEAMVTENNLLRRTFLATVTLRKELDTTLHHKIQLEEAVHSLTHHKQEAEQTIANFQKLTAWFPVRILIKLRRFAAKNRILYATFTLPRRLFRRIAKLHLRVIKERLYVQYRSIPFFYRHLDGLNTRNDFRILGIIRERNESLLLKDTLDHLASFVDGIVVFDDASKDRSVEIALKHPAVVKVIVNKFWHRNRSWEETINRAVLLKEAVKLRPEWIFYADADERFEGDIRKFLLEDCPPNVDGLRISLLDAYMTPGDEKPFKKNNMLLNFRKFFGVERRDILMAWRNTGKVAYTRVDSREPSGINEKNVVTRFFCQHYGKALSVKHWQDTCEYYINYFPQYRDKWQGRLGKAIHTNSDFGTKLETWPNAKKNSVKL